MTPDPSEGRTDAGTDRQNGDTELVNNGGTGDKHIPWVDSRERMTESERG